MPKPIFDDNSETAAAFGRLKKLRNSFPFYCSGPEQYPAMIGGCILEGFDTRRQILAAIRKLKMYRPDAELALDDGERADRWRCDHTGRYRLMNWPMHSLAS